MIIGFSYETKTGEWFVNWEKNNKYSFKDLYKNAFGYHVKDGKKTYYLTDEETKMFNIERKSLKKQLNAK